MANPTLCRLTKLGSGSKGNCVIFLQHSLNTISNYGIKEDGIFDNVTLNAVVHYQNSRKLTADGQVGDLTWTQIHNDLDTGVKTPAPTPAIQVAAAIADMIVPLVQTVSTTSAPISEAQVAVVPTIAATKAYTLPAEINWTTIGIIAAIGAGLFFMSKRKT